MTKAQQYAAAIRSFLTTAIVVLVGLIGLAALIAEQYPQVTIPASWIALATLLVGLARTLVAWLDSAMPLFGRGAVTTPPGGGEGGASGGAGDPAAGGEDVLVWDVDAGAPVEGD